MTETAGQPTAPTRTTTPDVPHHHEPNRLNQVLAWVGIVAGVVFIVAIVFFSGFFLGAHSGGGHPGMWGHHSKGMHMFHRGGPPPMGPGGPGSPGGPGGPGAQTPPGPATPTLPTPAPRP